MPSRRARKRWINNINVWQDETTHKRRMALCNFYTPRGYGMAFLSAPLLSVPDTEKYTFQGTNDTQKITAASVLRGRGCLYFIVTGSIPVLSFWENSHQRRRSGNPCVGSYFCSSWGGWAIYKSRAGRNRNWAIQSGDCSSSSSPHEPEMVHHADLVGNIAKGNAQFNYLQ